MYSTRRALIGAALLTVALSGCSGSNTQEDPSASAAEDSQDADISPTISVTDAWIKAADEGMTGGFGTITNPGDDVMLTGVSTPAATTTELHETVTNADGTMTMQEKEGGFEIAEAAPSRWSPVATTSCSSVSPSPCCPGTR